MRFNAPQERNDAALSAAQVYNRIRESIPVPLSRDIMHLLFISQLNTIACL
jgi:hypothetical protein